MKEEKTIELNDSRTVYTVKDAEEFVHGALKDIFEVMNETSLPKDIPDFKITMMNRTLTIPNNADTYEILASAAGACYELGLAMHDFEPDEEDCQCGCQCGGDFSQEAVQNLKPGDEFLGHRVLFIAHDGNMSQVILG